ncbi:putative holin-like toxin [Weissella cibaria]|nr:putative holin-like toxin [Weissella cibaria]MCQ9619930.1 putative holin-like toxin [Weissella cibaria]
MSVHDALSLMLAFGGFLLALLTITTTRSKDTKKPPKL